MKVRVQFLNFAVIVVAGNRNLGCDNSDSVVFITCSRNLSSRRIDDSDNRNIRETLLQIVKAGRSNRIAGNYHHFHIFCI